MRIDELIGKTIGDFIILKQDNTKGKYKYYCLCKCINCGFKKSISINSLLKNKSSECNICNKNFRKYNNKGYSEDLTGLVFGKLTVKSFSHSSDTHSYWFCQCSCGKKEIIKVTNLKSGKYLMCKDCRIKNTKGKKENIFEEKENYILINNKILIDKEDLYKIKKYNRYISINSNDYAYFRYLKTDIFIHRFVMNLPNRYDDNSNIISEHINGNTLDNRKNNLRICEKKLNPINCKIYENNTSGQKGVSYLKRLNKWQATINYNKKSHYLGVFENFEDAVNVRKKAEIKFYNGFNRE